MTSHDKDPLLTTARQLLDEKTEQLDAATLSKLKQARSRALERGGKTTQWQYWIPAGAIGAGFLAAGIYLNQLQPPLPAIFQDPAQLEVAENIDLMADLEFVAWLALEETN